MKGNRSMILSLASAIGLIACAPLMFNIFKNALSAYLRSNKPVLGAEVLIVEGWIFRSLVDDVKQEFDKGGYRYLFIPDEPPVSDTSSQSRPDSGSRGYALASRLMAIGVDSTKIRIMEVSGIQNHHTLSTALATRDWFAKNDPDVRHVNVCTAGIHARKTWNAYKRSFGKGYRVGILSIPHRNRPIHTWWKRCESFKWLLWRFGGALYAAVWPLSWVR